MTHEHVSCHRVFAQLLVPRLQTPLNTVLIPEVMLSHLDSLAYIQGALLTSDVPFPVSQRQGLNPKIRFPQNLSLQTF